MSAPGRPEKGDDVTITEAEAYEAMRAHHQMLDEQLSTYVAAVSGAVAAGCTARETIPVAMTSAK